MNAQDLNYRMTIPQSEALTASLASDDLWALGAIHTDAAAKLVTLTFSTTRSHGDEWVARGIAVDGELTDTPIVALRPHAAPARVEHLVEVNGWDETGESVEDSMRVESRVGRELDAQDRALDVMTRRSGIVEVGDVRVSSVRETTRVEVRVGGEGCVGCELSDDGDVENGPSLSVSYDASCPVHGERAS